MSLRKELGKYTRNEYYVHPEKNTFQLKYLHIDLTITIELVNLKRTMQFCYKLNMSAVKFSRFYI